MSRYPATLPSFESGGLQKQAHALLYGLFGVGLLATLLVLWKAYDYLFLVPLVLSGGLLFTFVARSETYLLCSVIIGFGFVAGYEEGFQVEELLYGMLYLSYLGWWFVTRMFYYRDPVLQTSTDWFLFLFLVYATLSLGLTFLFDGDPAIMASQWLSLTMLAFYFPVREICRRNPDALPVLLWTATLVVLFIALRNLWYYWHELSSADYLWQVAVGRVVENEHVLMFGAVSALAFWIHASGRLQRTVTLALFLVFSAGVVITLSRAVWLAELLGAFVIFVLCDKRHRARLLLAGVIGFGAVGLAGILVFDDLFSVVAAGLVDRFSTLQSALSKDISLINRFVENRAVWDAFLANPIVGYGMGVTYRYFSLIYQASYDTTFIHNTYFAVLYRHGLIGAALLFFFYGSAVWHGIRSFLRRSDLSWPNVTLLACAAALIAELLVGLANDAFSTSDRTLFIAIAAGLIMGLSGSAPTRPKADSPQV